MLTGWHPIDLLPITRKTHHSQKKFKLRFICNSRVMNPLQNARHMHSINCLEKRSWNLGKEPNLDFLHNIKVSGCYSHITTCIAQMTGIQSNHRHFTVSTTSHIKLSSQRRHGFIGIVLVSTTNNLSPPKNPRRWVKRLISYKSRLCLSVLIKLIWN